MSALSAALPSSWHIFTEVPLVETKPGFTLLTDADVLLAHPTRGFCFVELKAGLVRRRGRQWQQLNGRTNEWKDINPLQQATRCQREFVSWLKKDDIKKSLKGQYPQRDGRDNIPSIARVWFHDCNRPEEGLEQAAGTYFWAREIQRFSTSLERDLPAQSREIVDIAALVKAMVGDLQPDASPPVPEAAAKMDRTAELFEAVNGLKTLLESAGAEQQVAFSRLIREVTDSARLDISTDTIEELRNDVARISDVLRESQLSNEKLARLTSEIAVIKSSLSSGSNAAEEISALRNLLQSIQNSLEALKRQQDRQGEDEDVVDRRIDQIIKLFRAQKRRYVAATVFLVAALSIFVWTTLQAGPEIDRAISEPISSATNSIDAEAGETNANNSGGGDAGGNEPTDAGDSGASGLPLQPAVADPNNVVTSTSASTTLPTTTTSSTIAPALSTTTTTTTTTIPPVSYKPIVATQVSAGRWFTCALDSFGKSLCWGTNFMSQLGDGTTESRAFALPALGDRTFSAISSFDVYSCGLDSSGVAYCWGNGDYQGASGSTIGNVPTRVEAPQAFVSIHVAASSSCGITANAVAYCWGTDAAPIDFRSWRRSRTPIEFDSSIAISSISAGYSRGCYVEPSGSASCWPANTNDERPAILPFPHQFAPETLTGFKHGYPNGGHSCARDVVRGWICWGSNDQGQLGAIDGLQCGSATAFCSNFFRNTLSVDFATIEAGEGFNCGLKRDGEIWCWGRNDFGQLGRGTNVQRPTAEQLRQNATPTPISSSLRFSSLAVGTTHACGVTRDTKSVWCWGDNTYGQLGNRSRSNSFVPVESVRRG